MRSPLSIRRLVAGRAESMPFPQILATLSADVRGNATWTQFIHAMVEKGGDGWRVRPLKQASRLQSMACKNALIMLPEGCDCLPGGSAVPVQLLDASVLHLP